MALTDKISLKHLRHVLEICCIKLKLSQKILCTDCMEMTWQILLARNSGTRYAHIVPFLFTIKHSVLLEFTLNLNLVIQWNTTLSVLECVRCVQILNVDSCLQLFQHAQVFKRAGCHLKKAHLVR